MTPIGTFTSKRWGLVSVLRGTYLRADGPTAIALALQDGEPLAKLSANFYPPECSHNSSDLPPGCFYVKTWAENQELWPEAFASGLFKLRADLGFATAGFVRAPVWQVVE